MKKKAEKDDLAAWRRVFMAFDNQLTELKYRLDKTQVLPHYMSSTACENLMFAAVAMPVTISRDGIDSDEANHIT